jgi:hypothetical protein
MSYDPLQTLKAEPARVQDGGGFTLYDPHTGATIRALPCWRCGRNIRVDDETYKQHNSVTCATCAQEIRPSALAK